jgi:hypothetical protein
MSPSSPVTQEILVELITLEGGGVEGVVVKLLILHPVMGASNSGASAGELNHSLCHHVDLDDPATCADAASGTVKTRPVNCALVRDGSGETSWITRIVELGAVMSLMLCQ